MQQHEIPDAINERFGEQMRTAREGHKISQRKLAAELKRLWGLTIDASAITRIERGQRDPKLSEAIAISAVLGIELDSMGQLEPADDIIDSAQQRLAAIREQIVDLGNLYAKATRSRAIEIAPSPGEVSSADRYVFYRLTGSRGDFTNLFGSIVDDATANAATEALDKLYGTGVKVASKPLERPDWLDAIEGETPVEAQEAREEHRVGEHRVEVQQTSQADIDA